MLHFSPRALGSVLLLFVLSACASSTPRQGPAQTPEAPSAGQETPARETTRISSLNAMSFNIRFNTPDDGEHAWPYRRDHVASVIRFHEADVAGLQEALIGQIRDLQERLPAFEWVGVGRDDGDMAGEFSPIFYRTDRLELLGNGTFWLSETPAVAGSQSWDAALPRIATWARFRDRRTGGTFYHFNTHFDHVGETARLQSARLLTERIAEMAGEASALLTGDFNVTPNTAPYAHLSGALTDAFAAVETPHGPPGTYFGFEVIPEEGRRIDYIFTTEAPEAIERFGTLTDQWRGDYASDHLPVFAEVRLRR